MKYLYSLILVLTLSVAHSQTFVKNFTFILDHATIGDQTYFAALHNTEGFGIWKTDGTVDGTVLFKRFSNLQQPAVSGTYYETFFTVFNNELYYVCNDGIHGLELWKTNGTTEGTVMVKDIEPSLTMGANPSELTVVNNELYFRASDNGSYYQLWKTDGTADGTVKIYPTTTTTNNISSVNATNENVYFIEGNNTLKSYNISTGVVSEIPTANMGELSEFNVANNQLFFKKTLPNSGLFWLYTVTNTNTPVLLQEYTSDPNAGISFQIQNLTTVGNLLYYSVMTNSDSETDSDNIWKTDGTLEGTTLVKSFESPTIYISDGVDHFYDIQGQLFFLDNNNNVWKSDGTSDGTTQIIDLSINSSIALFDHNNYIYFISSSKLWRSNNTGTQVEQVMDLTISPLLNTIDKFSIGALNSTVFVEAIHGENNALYTTDASPKLLVTAGGFGRPHNSTIHFDSKIDSAVSTTVTIRNTGTKKLYLSNIEVVGQNYYTSSFLELTNTILPGNERDFDLIFYPSTAGKKLGKLYIYSNSSEAPNYVLNLEGYVKDEVAEPTDTNIILTTQLNLVSSNNLIDIDNNTIEENTDYNTLIGNLSIPNTTQEYVYELNSSVNNTDNNLFTIENNQLKSNYSFNYESRSTFIVSVKATNSTTNEVVEQDLLINITDVNEAPELNDCDLSKKLANYKFNPYSTCFIDNLHAIIVGSDGVILKSDDSGDTWRMVRHDYDKDLNYVQFTSSTIGYAVGDVLLKTTDGGENWYELDIPDPSTNIGSTSYFTPFEHVTNFFFVNDNTGYTFSTEGSLFKTTDGGATWVYHNLEHENLRMAYFINESKGFIATTEEFLFKTEDGGENWSHVDLSDVFNTTYSQNVTDIQFVDNATGYISTSKGEVLKTTDGGSTWVSIYEIPMHYKINDINFYDANTGYMLGDSGDVLKTTDGGITWEIELEYLQNLASIALNSDNTKACLVGSHSLDSNYFGNFIFTRDNNNTWEQVSDLLATGSSLLYFVNDDVQIIINNSGNSVKSLDNGITWHTITQPNGNATGAYAYNNVIYLTYLNSHYKSTDYGETWINLGNEQFYGLNFINDQVIFGAGIGAIKKTTDGGLTLTYIYPPISEPIHFFYFVDENYGFMSTSSGSLFYTTDSGNNWTEMFLDNTSYNFQVSSMHIRNNIGYMSTNNGLFKTTDNGLTWTHVDIVFPAVTQLYAYDDNTWYGIGDNIYKSTDGGNTWSIISYNLVSSVTRCTIYNNTPYIILGNSVGPLEDTSTVYATSPIEGDIYVSQQTATQYNVMNTDNVGYEWTVTGNNDITNYGNTAEIFWNEPGEYQITVTPYNNCSQGTPTQITVTVLDLPAPIITGLDYVEEYSTNNLYSTDLTPNARYNWFVWGQTNDTPNNNTISIDWAQAGNATINVIKTYEDTGIRKTGTFNVVKHTLLLPETNFSIQTVNESCPNMDNGKINISAVESYNYIATINNQQYNFTNNLTVENLAPGIYDLCIGVNASAFSQCYTLEIEESEQIEGNTITAYKSVAVNITTGTAPYSVFVNNQLVLETSEKAFTVTVENGDNLEVTTSKVCEGSLSKTINTTGKIVAFPNPSTGNFSVRLPNNQETVTVDIFTAQSKLISSRNYSTANGEIKLDISNEPSGVYFAKIYLNEPVILKLIKL